MKFENSIKTTKFFETSEKFSKIKETVLIIFFIDLVVFLFDWLIFFCLELILSNLRKIYINEYHLHRSKIRIKRNRYFSIENRTKRTSFALESRKIEHTFNLLLQTEQTKSLVILIVKIINVFDDLQMSHVMSKQSQIIFEEFFIKYLTLSRMSIFLNTS